MKVDLAAIKERFDNGEVTEEDFFSVMSLTKGLWSKDRLDPWCRLPMTGSRSGLSVFSSIVNRCEAAMDGARAAETCGLRKEFRFCTCFGLDPDSMRQRYNGIDEEFLAELQDKVKEVIGYEE